MTVQRAQLAVACVRHDDYNQVFGILFKPFLSQFLYCNEKHCIMLGQNYKRLKELSMGRLDQAPTRNNFKIVNEPEKARTIVYKFLFNLMQNLVQFYFYKLYFTVYSCATLS